MRRGRTPGVKGQPPLSAMVPASAWIDKLFGAEPVAPLRRNPQACAEHQKGGAHEVPARPLRGRCRAAHVNRSRRADRPGRNVRIVVPFPPGGTADILARVLGEQIGKTGGPTILVENRPGGGTVIATEQVARAAPDGNTLLLMANSFVINAAVRASLPYDPLTSFEPVCLMVNSPQIMVVNATSPFKTLKRFRRRGEGQARRDQLRHRRPRHHAAHRVRDVQPRRRHQAHLCAVRRRRAGDHRAGRRPCHGGARQSVRGDGAGARRQAARHRGRLARALRAAARHADHHRRPASRTSRRPHGSAWWCRPRRRRT